MDKPHVPKAAKPNQFAVSTAPAFIRIEEGRPMLSFTFSSHLSEPDDGLNEVLQFSERVLDYDVAEVVLDVRSPLDAILDLTVEGYVLSGAPDDGMDHVSDNYRGEIDAIKTAIRAMLDRLNRIQYHNPTPDK